MKYRKFFQKLEELKHQPDLCDELNGDGVFGTEGWEHAVGLDW